MLALTAVSPADAVPPPGHDRWTPTTADRLHLQFQGPLDVPDWATLVEVDGADTTTSQVRDLRQRGLRAACYVSAGTRESWRADADRFPAAVVGRRLADWPGERWIDVRRLEALGPIMRDRIAQCARKGFDAIEFDNVDGWTNDTGFAITRADSRRYLRWLIDQGHRHGLAVGLKNALGLVRDLADEVDWALNEQCVQYDECGRYAPLVRRGIPVFVLEYRGSQARMCGVAAREGVIAQMKRLSLDAWTRPCLGARGGVVRE